MRIGRKTCTSFLLIAGLVLAGFWVPTWAQDAPDETGLTEAQERLVEMIRARDVEGIAGLFLSTGVMILPDGTVLSGPEEIVEHWTERWAGESELNPLREYPKGTVGSGMIVVEGGGYGPDAAGRPIADYARVWERDEENQWRIRVFLLTQ